MIKCIAIDDEPLALMLLSDNIKKIPYLQLVASCESVQQAMEVMHTETVDLLFIDIQMPRITGLQFLASLNTKPMAVLVTAYKEFALEAYELDVIDYLLKPVSLPRFMAACNKANELYQLRQGQQRKKDTSKKSTEYFFLYIDYTQVKVNYRDIVWIEGLRDYIKIHLSEGRRPLVVRMNIKTLELQLPTDGFLRIHRSYLVAQHRITAVRKNSVFIDDLELPVGDTYMGAIKKITG